MTRNALLVAGPLALDDLPQQQGLLGGGGGYAAIAASALVPTQLWARGGSHISAQVRGILERRQIDLAGVTWEGPTARWSGTGFASTGPVLPTIEPTNAENLGAVLAIDLPPACGARAFAAFAKLDGAATRPVIVAPRPADCTAHPGWLQECAKVADVLILPAALAAAAEGAALSDPLALAERIRTWGAKCVVLTRGPFGGLVVYQNKATTYPAMPITVVEPTGIGSAFAGVLAAWCAGAGKADFNAIKRGLAMASAVASICAQGVGPKKLLTADNKEYSERFNKLRRTNKF